MRTNFDIYVFIVALLLNFAKAKTKNTRREKI